MLIQIVTDVTVTTTTTMASKEVTEADLDSSMTDLSWDNDEPAFLSTTSEEKVVNVSTESEEDDGIPYYTMQDILSPKIGSATRRPGLKLMSKEQKDQHLEKYGEDGDKLRPTVETRHITKVTRLTRVAKVHYCPVPDLLAPVWHHRAEVYMGKLVHSDKEEREEVEDQVVKITRAQFIDRAAE